MYTTVSDDDNKPPRALHSEHEPATETREVYLRDGKRLVIDDSGAEQLVEIRGESGLLEVRIRLTAEGPVLQMESVRMQLKATEAVEIASKVVAITATEQAVVEAKQIELTSEHETEIESTGEVIVRGKMIYLN